MILPPLVQDITAICVYRNEFTIQRRTSVISNLKILEPYISQLTQGLNTGIWIYLRPSEQL